MQSFAIFPKSILSSSRSFINLSPKPHHSLQLSSLINMNRSKGPHFSSSSDSGPPHHSNSNQGNLKKWVRKDKKTEAVIVENTTTSSPRGVEKMVKSSYRGRPVVDDSLREGGQDSDQQIATVGCNFASVVYPAQDDLSNSVTRKNGPSLNRTSQQRGSPWGSVDRTTSKDSLEASGDGGFSKQHRPLPKYCDKVVNASQTEGPLSAVSTSESVMSQTKAGLEDGSPPRSYDFSHGVRDYSMDHSSKTGRDRVGRHKSPESSRKGMSQHRSKSPNRKYPECSSTQAVFQALETDQNAVKGHSRGSPTKRESSCHSPDFGDEPYTPIDLFLRKPKTIILKASLLEQKREKKKDFEHSIKDSRPLMLRPGMVLLKSFITPEDQIKILKKCRDTGLGPGGFYKPGYSDGAKLRLHMMCLGKNWDPERSYEELRSIDGAKPPIIPDEFRKLVGDAIQTSHVMIQQNGVKYPEKAIPWMKPDICIVNFYTNTGKLGLHQDRDESPESITSGLPVVSFSIGDSAEFLYGEDRDVDKAEKILLKSGDILIFGGKSRLVFHGVSSIIPDTAPKFLVDEVNLRPGRLNLTFRQY